MPVKKPPSLTKEQSICLEHELIPLYAADEFQRRLHELSERTDADPINQGKARQQACLPAQISVITKYGFEGSRRGVCQSVNAFKNFNMDYDEQLRSYFMTYLINPGHQRLADCGELSLSGSYIVMTRDHQILDKCKISHSKNSRRFTVDTVSYSAEGRLCGLFMQWKNRDVNYWAMAQQGGSLIGQGYCWKEPAEICAIFYAYREDQQSSQEEAHGKEEGEAQMVLLEHLDHKCPLIYGGLMGSHRAPSVFMRSAEQEEAATLMEYIRQDPDGPFKGLVDDWPNAQTCEQGRWGRWKFARGGEQEPLLKADWHSVHAWGYAANAFVPRAASICVLKRAPRRLLAFIECFREVNGHCWTAVLRALEDLKLKTKSGDAELHDIPWLVDFLCRAMRKRGHFGAMEAQVWWGKKSITTRSHKDGATSLLHLSITLSGRRSVRVGSFDDPLAPMVRDPGTHQRAQENVWEDCLWYQGRLQTIDLRPGMVYCSAPFVFEHGVAYERCEHDDPVIAVQCRFAFSDLGEAEYVNTLRNGSMRAISTVIAETIKEFCNRGELRMPSLDEVRNAEQALEMSEAKLSGGQREDFDLFKETPEP